MNVNDYTVLKFHKQREQEAEIERKHQALIKDAKDQKVALRGIIPYKLNGLKYQK